MVGGGGGIYRSAKKKKFLALGVCVEGGGLGHWLGFVREFWCFEA